MLEVDRKSKQFELGMKIRQIASKNGSRGIVPTYGVNLDFRGHQEAKFQANPGKESRWRAPRRLDCKPTSGSIDPGKLFSCFLGQLSCSF